MPHIALFGGSFNPPHLGHVLCAIYAKVMANVDAVWVLPVVDHPYGKDLAAWDLRWQMCQAAFQSFPFIKVRDDEKSNAGGKTFTLIERLQSRYPHHQFSLIGGSDTRDDLSNWYRGDELRDLVNIIAIPRRGYDDNEPSALPLISSSLVRERCAAAAAIDDLVPAAVAQIIRSQHLYCA